MNNEKSVSVKENIFSRLAKEVYQLHLQSALKKHLVDLELCYNCKYECEINVKDIFKRFEENDNKD